jgi:large subunit ribosomal protein L3
MINTILGQKFEMTQDFTQKGIRIPLTKIIAGPCIILEAKTREKDGYNALKIGFGQKKFKNITNPQKGQLKEAKLKMAPFYIQELKIDDPQKYKVGDQIIVTDILAPGDEIQMTGISKGKGFTGVVKRWGFAGGPRTHGQSDRERAPGSIGQTTTPGRVIKGKKMAGRAGGKKITLKKLHIMAVNKEKNQILVKGSIPGAKKGFLIITKTGKVKNFDPLQEPKKPKLQI